MFSIRGYPTVFFCDPIIESNEIKDLKFANKIVKHSKSNAIVLVKNKQMISSGVGQTSRVDALNFAIAKAKVFNSYHVFCVDWNCKNKFTYCIFPSWQYDKNTQYG